MKKLLAKAIILLLSAALVLPIAGCDGDTKPIDSGTARWLELLNVIPERNETFQDVHIDTNLGVYIQDLAFLRELQAKFPVTEPYAVLKISIPGSEGLFRHYYDMTDPEADIEEEYRETIGFTFDDVDQMVSSGRQPYIYEAYRGTFDKTEIDTVVKIGTRSEDLEVVQYGGMEYYRWGEDNAANLSARTHVRPLGRGHRLALPGDFAFWTVWDEGVETMIDCYNDTAGSLADIDEFKLMAEGLTILDAFSGYMTTGTNSYDEAQDYLKREGLPAREGHYDRFTLSLEETPLLKPYTAMATGAGLDEDGYYLAIVLVNPDNNTAEENVSLLEERISNTRDIWQGRLWSEMATRVTVESQDRLTLVTLYGLPVEFWPDRFGSLSVVGSGAFEPLLVHE
ncbi:MAG TPA: hypothetical protein G4O15_12560 [Dehalococcoidia bacterium]|nr:hypothetical protein [Dehalococcoidia bacterium]